MDPLNESQYDFFLDNEKELKGEVLNKKATSSSSSDKEIEQIFQKSIENQQIQSEYLDKYKLLKSDFGEVIEPQYFDWFLHQAILFEQMDLKEVDLATQRQLSLVLLHGYSKAAPFMEEEISDIQRTPFLLDGTRYHRSTANVLLEKVYEAYAKNLGIEPHEVFLIDSPLFKEVLDRELSQPGLNLEIESKEAFEKLIDDLFFQVKNHGPLDRYILIDFSKYLNAKSIEPKEIKNTIIPEFEDILLRKLETFLKENPQIKKEDMTEKLLNWIHLAAFTHHENQHLLLLPEFLGALNSPTRTTFEIPFGGHGRIYRLLDDMMSRTGFRMDPAQAKEAWLKTQDVTQILKKNNLGKAELATKGEKIPLVCKNFQEFMKMPVVNKFRNLSHQKNSPPYLEVLPEATWRLLDGLSKYEERGGIHSVFQQKGIEDLIQISYFRMMNAMNEAIFRKDTQIIFHNQIELIHQEIQTILSIVQPYDNQTLSKTVIDKMTSGSEPLISNDLPSPHVHAKASAMRGFSSILASVEKEKQSNQLNIVLLKDSYYESSDVLTNAKTYQVQIFNGDLFEKEGIEKAFENPPNMPIDLFVCEFRHNIASKKQEYKPENILHQVKSMIQKGLTTEKFTVAIDATLDLEQSKNIRDFLSDGDIKKWVNEGKLNVVFLRSAQKFDMLGMDNYYGGIITSINQPSLFEQFNTRMNDPEDQLAGLSYQGLSHLQKYAGNSLDSYRQKIIQNTQKLYDQLPKDAIYHEGMQNPMQISKNTDSELFFIDIEFPLDYMNSARAFKSRLMRLANEEHLPFTTRASFGFSTTNLTTIQDATKFRLNPGLDSEKTLDRYVAFFHAVQETVRKTMEENRNKTKKEINGILQERIHYLQIP